MFPQHRHQLLHGLPQHMREVPVSIPFCTIVFMCVVCYGESGAGADIPSGADTAATAPPGCGSVADAMTGAGGTK